MNAAEEGAGAFIVSGCNGSILLEFGEEVFDQVPSFFVFLAVIFEETQIKNHQGILVRWWFQVMFVYGRGNGGPFISI